MQSDTHVSACVSCVCVSSLDVLADLPLEAVPAFLQLFDGAFLGELVGSASHLCLRHAACEQLLKYHIIYHCVVKTGTNDKHRGSKNTLCLVRVKKELPFVLYFTYNYKIFI